MSPNAVIKLPVVTHARLVTTGERMPITEVSPGEFIATVPRSELPLFAVAELSSDPGGRAGRMQARVKVWTAHVRITDHIGERIGVDISPKTLKRLVKTGFVRGSRPTPRMTVIDLSSLFDHLEAAAKPGFWTATRLAQWDEWRKSGDGEPDFDDFDDSSSPED